MTASQLLRFSLCLLGLRWLAYAVRDRVRLDFVSGTLARGTYDGVHVFRDRSFDTSEALKWRDNRRSAGWQRK